MPNQQQLPLGQSKHHNCNDSISAIGTENGKDSGQAMAHKIEGVLEDPEVRQELFKLWKEATTYKDRIIRFLSLIR